ncbi:MAG TPA: hypothetical protein VJY33_17030 [Isosphaeraceae bacterium]|nr:hypothetical protein [Isosphaeraceae bacterium]
MEPTASHETLIAIRTLVDYLENDERKDYLQQLEQGEGGNHIYQSIAQIEKWLSGQTQVLHMVAGSDIDFGLPQADCEILTAQEAAERFQAMIEEEQLPPIQYNPETDKVQARYVPSDAMGHHFYGFAPLAAETPASYTELTYEQSNIPLGRWQVKVNDVVVYQEPGDEEETTIVGDSGTGEEDCTTASVHGG